MVRFDLTHDDRQKAQLSSPPHSDLHLQQKPVVHGDKEKPELTRQYNEGYKTDLAEPHTLTMPLTCADRTAAVSSRRAVGGYAWVSCSPTYTTTQTRW